MAVGLSIPLSTSSVKYLILGVFAPQKLDRPIRSTTPGKCGVHLFSTAIVTMIMSTSSMLGIDGVVPVVERIHNPSSGP